MKLKEFSQVTEYLKPGAKIEIRKNPFRSVCVIKDIRYEHKKVYKPIIATFQEVTFGTFLWVYLPVEGLKAFGYQKIKSIKSI